MTPERRAPSVAPVPFLATLALVVAGCLPAPATEQGQATSNLWAQFMIAAVIVGGLVWGLITIAVLRFRRRSTDDVRVAPQESHTPRLEIAWTLGPIVVVLILFALTLGAMSRVDAREPSRVTVDVLAYRWQWRFSYEGTPVVVDGDLARPAEMVVPAGEPVHVLLTAQDVDHSFFVPQFLFKRDAIPGKPNDFDFTVSEPGTYRGQCAEFCGVFHDRMLLSVRAVTRPEFDAWLAAAAAGSSAAPSAAGSSAGPSAAGSSAAPSAAAPSGSAP